MRISDWSSDVCSSDLDGRPDQSLCDFGTSQANTEIIAFGDYCRSLFHHQLHRAILAAKRLDVPRNTYGVNMTICERREDSLRESNDIGSTTEPRSRDFEILGPLILVAIVDLFQTPSVF